MGNRSVKNTYLSMFINTGIIEGIINLSKYTYLPSYKYLGIALFSKTIIKVSDLVKFFHINWMDI